MKRLLLFAGALLVGGCSVDLSLAAWFPNNTDEARSVAHCESRMNPTARGGSSHGLLQIHEVHTAQFEAVTGQPFYDGAYVAWFNAQYARWLYDQAGSSWSAWARVCRP